MEAEQFSLCWNNFHNNLRTGFHSLLQDEDLVDVTLAAEGRYLKAHKTVLSVCSPYFKELFRANPCKHPIVILQDVHYSAMKSLLQFMYQGEVSVGQDEIPTFMRVAEMLKIKGLTENNTTTSNTPSTDTNGVEDDNRDSPYMYDNLEPRQIMKRTRPAKKLLRPIQHLRPLESPKTVKSPSSVKSPQPVSSPQPPPSKKQCIEEASERIADANPPINPKQEPEDQNDDEFNEDNNLDMSSMLDTTLNESHPSGSWTPDLKVPADTSSPGTLQCVLGKRGNPRLIVDGHTFFKKSTYKGKSFWYCKHSRTPYKCQAVCWTLNGQIVKWPTNHSHVVMPEPFNPEEDMEVPIERLQEVLLQSAW